MLVILIIIISILLETNLSNILPLNSYLFPLFTLTSLVLIYPFFNNDNKQYLKYTLVTGLLYDIILTDTLFLNMFIFLIIAQIIKKINITLSNNIINVMLITIIIITTYLLITYTALYLIGYHQFELNILLTTILKSYLVNIIYSIILYIITDKISRKYKISKID